MNVDDLRAKLGELPGSMQVMTSDHDWGYREDIGVDVVEVEQDEHGDYQMAFDGRRVLVIG